MAERSPLALLRSSYQRAPRHLSRARGPDTVIVAILDNAADKPSSTWRTHRYDPRDRRVIGDPIRSFGPARGLRARDGSDLARAGTRGADYESSCNALMNRRLGPEVETVFLMAKEEYSYVSSRLVKEVARLKGDVRGLVPELVRQRLLARF